MYGTLPSKFEEQRQASAVDYSEINELYKSQSKCGWFVCQMMKWCGLLFIGTIFSFITFLVVMSYIDSKSEVVGIAQEWNKDISNTMKTREYYDNDYVSNNFVVYVIVSESRKEYVENMVSNVLEWDTDIVNYVDGISKDGFDRGLYSSAGCQKKKECLFVCLFVCYNSFLFCLFVFNFVLSR